MTLVTMQAGRAGLVNVALLERRRRWVAVLLDPHPTPNSVNMGIGLTAADALRNLRGALLAALPEDQGAEEETACARWS